MWLGCLEPAWTPSLSAHLWEQRRPRLPLPSLRAQGQDPELVSLYPQDLQEAQHLLKQLWVREELALREAAHQPEGASSQQAPVPAFEELCVPTSQTPLCQRSHYEVGPWTEVSRCPVVPVSALPGGSCMSSHGPACPASLLELWSNSIFTRKPV